MRWEKPRIKDWEDKLLQGRPTKTRVRLKKPRVRLKELS